MVGEWGSRALLPQAGISIRGPALERQPTECDQVTEERPGEGGLVLDRLARLDPGLGAAFQVVEHVRLEAAGGGDLAGQGAALAHGADEDQLLVLGQLLATGEDG